MKILLLALLIFVVSAEEWMNVGYGTFETTGNSVCNPPFLTNLVLYPTNSCFVPIDDMYGFYTSYSYKLLCNETHVNQWRWTSNDCSGSVEFATSSIRTDDGEDHCPAVYRSCNSASEPIPPSEPYAAFEIQYNCDCLCDTLYSVTTFHRCQNGLYYHCNDNAFHYQNCTSSDCSDGCTEVYTPLTIDLNCISGTYSGDWSMYFGSTYSSYTFNCWNGDSSSSAVSFSVALIVSVLAFVF